MPDTPGLAPRDFDPWLLATPRQLLALMERLGVNMSQVARDIPVSRSSISMWRHEARSVPPKHLATLRTLAKRALEQAAELTDKAAALAPTEDLRQAIRTEFGALWQRWKSEVLAEAGTLRRSLQHNYAALGQWLAHEPFMAEDLESIRIVMDTIAQQVALLMELEGVADPEQALLDRLAQAHADAPRTAPGQGEA
jgi:hypothetical protein